jgi:hypothetical protein
VAFKRQSVRFEKSITFCVHAVRSTAEYSSSERIPYTLLMLYVEMSQSNRAQLTRSCVISICTAVEACLHTAFYQRARVYLVVN